VGSIRISHHFFSGGKWSPTPCVPLWAQRGTAKEKCKCATMEIIHEEKNGIVCVTVKGRMEAGLAPAFEKTIKEIISSDRRRLLFDLYRFS
jgi:hypothetical protein